MAKANFYLKDPQAKGETLIYLFFSFNGQRLKFSTGQAISPKFWNRETERARETRLFPQYLELNALLHNIATQAFNVYREAVNNGRVPSIAELRDALNERVKTAIPIRSQPLQTLSFDEFMQNFIQERRENSKYSRAIIGSYETALTQLKAFSAGRRIEFEQMGIGFWDRYLEYLTQKEFAQNTVHRHIKTLKTVLHDAQVKGIANADKAKIRRGLIAPEDVDKIYLNAKELSALFALDLSEMPRLRRVRDLFLIGANTGLRFSDWDKVNAANIRTIDGKDVLQIETQKTGERVKIPLSPIVRAILEDNGGLTPEKITNQKMNDYLKELGALAGLNEPVTFARTEGGQRVERKFQKWELLCTHTARRSFATNAYKAGIPQFDIMKLTGHKTEKSFMRYIQITKEENAVNLSGHEFFNAPVMRKVVSG